MRGANARTALLADTASSLKSNIEVWIDSNIVSPSCSYYFSLSHYTSRQATYSDHSGRHVTKVQILKVEVDGLHGFGLSAACAWAQGMSSFLLKTILYP